MKHWAYLFLLTLISCNSQQNNIPATIKALAPSLSNSTGNNQNLKKDICWAGTLNSKIPVFIHYQLDDKLIIGEITYLKTKDKLPIKLLGTIEEDKNYRLLEFDNKGNITGVIEGKPTAKNFTGVWTSPQTKHEMPLQLSLKDTSINSPEIQPGEAGIFGNYHYQYGEMGYSGNLEINKVVNNKIDFNIISLTNADRGPNIAEVEKDTIEMTGTHFIYKIPGSDSCEFRVTFYKGFLYINYTKGYCENQFGSGATIDGIYLKTN